MGNAHLLMKCRVVYAGNMLPIFAWTKEDTQEALATDSTTSGSHTVLRTTISSVIRQLHSDDNGVTFKCMITFQLPHNSQGNDPDYEYRWNYDLCKYCFMYPSHLDSPFCYSSCGCVSFLNLSVRIVNFYTLLNVHQQK